MPSRRNPFQMSHLLGQVRRSLDQAKAEVRDRTQEWAEKNGVEMKYVDVAIQFIGASGIPKMDVVGTADPYFIAKLDDRVKYVCVFGILSCQGGSFAMKIHRAGQHAEPGVERVLEDQKCADDGPFECRGDGQGRRYNNGRHRRYVQHHYVARAERVCHRESFAAEK